MKLATYGRKSVYSDKSDSIDNQERMCREYADFRFKVQVESFESYSPPKGPTTSSAGGMG